MKRKLYRIQRLQDAKIMSDVVIGGYSYEKALVSNGAIAPKLYHKWNGVHMFQDANGWLYNVICGLDIAEVA